ncbi:MAG: ABC transporter ATP-binding protein [Deltaproteobacteria bacterium]|nr:ABC transporter ATP-binding protein [Deltaproteobacteria bacterium]
MTLECVNLSCGYGRTNSKNGRKQIVVQDVSFSLDEGEVVCLFGPNGAGKTTFFRTLLGFIKPLDGKVFIDGTDVAQMKPSKLATRIAYVPQFANVPFPFSVEEVVLMGRGVHVNSMLGPSPLDCEKAQECMASLGISHLAKKVYSRLSGGERQMVLIARALTQDARYLVLDEPTSNLDFGNRIRILERILELKERGIGIIMTTHSPDQVLQLGTRVVVFNRGAMTRTGCPQTVVTSSLMRNVYGVDVVVKEMHNNIDSPVSVCVPCLRHPSQNMSSIKEKAV